MRVALLGLVGAAACGDNFLPDGEPLSAAPNLTIVAHQDDDLLFMQPDELEAVQHGAGTTNVYVTAGNANRGVDYSELRDRALMAAYAQIADDDAWSCGWITVADHPAQHCRLASVKLSLVFLDYPDGGKDGSQPASLLHLWEGVVEGADTVARRSTHYDQAGLIDSVAALIATTQPTTIRTLEVAATHGRDHPDHMFVGALTILAAAQSGTSAQLISYRGYNTDVEPENVIAPIFARSLDALAHYEACAADGDACGRSEDPVAPSHVVWLHRRYGVGFRGSAAGALRLDGDRCATATPAGALALVACAGAPSWTFTPDGGMRLAEQCVQALPTGELVMGACGRSAFRLDDEGHIWAGVVPVPTENMDLDHGSCLAAVGDRIRAVLCGATKIGTWTVEPAQMVTPRATLGLARRGRAIVLARSNDGDAHADLCELAPDPGGLQCAHGLGNGGFAPATFEGPAITGDPTSLAFGIESTEGAAQGIPGFCVRQSSGVACSDGALTSFQFTSAFSDADTVGATSASLAYFGGNVCGLSKLGVQCAAQSSFGVPTVLSSAPARDVPLLVGDLDGDRQPDWCSLTAAGPVCTLGAERILSTDGAPWSFALGGTAEVLSPVAALGDIDGDGRADLCAIVGTTVRCARSQGYGFGPSLPVLVHSAPLVGVWLGDLDGDGRADVCADDGTSFICQRD